MNSDGHYIFYKDRPEWSDVKPVPQDEDPRGVIKIAYSENFVDVHDYLRAVLASNEKSERALALTKDAIILNPANYTTWAFRRQILEALDVDLNVELDMVGQIILEHLKNYQVWYHRQWIVEKLRLKSVSDAEAVANLYSVEFSFVEEALSDDSKNYHAWQYLTWVCQTFKVPLDKQLEMADNLILEDSLNNSAWNFRFYAIQKNGGLSDDILGSEIKYVKSKITICPANESAWNYLYGLVNPLPSAYLTTNKGEAKYDSMKKIPSKVMANLSEFVEELINSNSSAGGSIALLSFLVEVYNDSFLLGMGQEDEFKNKAAEICDRLCQIDKVRSNFWSYRKRQLDLIESC